MIHWNESVLVAANVRRYAPPPVKSFNDTRPAPARHVRYLTWRDVMRRDVTWHDAEHNGRNGNDRRKYVLQVRLNRLHLPDDISSLGTSPRWHVKSSKYSVVTIGRPAVL
jgi:hypothetical protein